MKTINSLLKRIKRKEKTLLIFDYDGTLVPIRNKPDAAVMDSVVRKAVENLSKFKFLKIAVVTGRSIKDLKKLSGLNTAGITVYGIHGGEIEVHGKTAENIENNKILKSVKNVYAGLRKKLSQADGIIIENKKYSVAMHYRLSNAPQPALDIFFEIVKKYEKSGLFKIQKGKKVVELLPCEFSKDKAVSDIMQKNKDYLPVYFGDDVTDIGGFKEVRKFAGYAVGIKPLSFKNDNLVDFEIEQNELKKFIIKLSSFALTIQTQGENSL
jgi:trehalose 6-phosphate phosphatase